MFRRTEDMRKKSEDYWSEIVAPFLATKLIETHQMTLYPDLHAIPAELTNYDNAILTLLLHKPHENKYSRVYLWIGTREEAKEANCLLEDKTNVKGYVGRFVLVQTVLPHDFELYNKFEIIQESSPEYDGTFGNIEVNKIVTSTPQGKHKLDTDVLFDLVQRGVEQFVIKLMELESSGSEIIGIYITKRTMRRGKSTVFAEDDILLGDHAQIISLREEEDSDEDEFSSEGSEKSFDRFEMDGSDSEDSESESESESES